jgi:hypothetical protein
MAHGMGLWARASYGVQKGDRVTASPRHACNKYLARRSSFTIASYFRRLDGLLWNTDVLRALQVDVTQVFAASSGNLFHDFRPFTAAVSYPTSHHPRIQSL